MKLSYGRRRWLILDTVDTVGDGQLSKVTGRRRSMTSSEERGRAAWSSDLVAETNLNLL